MDEEKTLYTVGGEEAGYLFEFNQDGVFLTVYPSESGGVAFELADMRQILKDYNVFEYDITILARAVREMSGEPVKLAESFTPPKKSEDTLAELDALANLGDLSDLGITLDDLTGSKPKADSPASEDVKYGRVMIDVSRDRMTATARIELHNNEVMPTTEQVLAALKERGVVFGIDEDVITEGILSGEKFIVAQGIPPTNGEDAYIDRKFDLGEKGRPKKNEYDQVDYRNLNLFVLAKKGDMLAIRIPQTQGRPGKDVFGNDVAAKHGRPVPLPVGRNVKVVDDECIVAEIDGQIIDDGKRISVDPRLDIKGDVGMKTGNIDFDGSVNIGGNVETGFIVKATGDITIKGMISGAHVEGRNVNVTGGVNGMNRGRVKAIEDVRIAFAENADVEAGGTISVADVALHSTLKAGKRIVVEGKSGQIVGGLAASGEEIKATLIGNPAGVITKLAVGVNPSLQEKYQRVCQDYIEAKKRLQQVTRALNTLGKIDVNQLPPERVKQITALTKSQFPLAGQVKRDETIIRKLDEELRRLKDGKVRVSGTIYPGVRMTINSVMKNIQSETAHCMFTIKGDDIEMVPF